MKDFLEKIIRLIPGYFSDLLGLVSGPKHFVADRLSREDATMEGPLRFVAVSFMMSWIIELPLARSDPIVQLAVDGAFVLAYVLLYGAVLCLAWRIVGGRASLKQFFAIHFYYAGMLLLITACFFLATMGLLRALDPGLYGEVYGAAYSGNLPSFALQNLDRLWHSSAYKLSLALQVLGLVSGLAWIVIGWGAYRALNKLTRARACVAGALFILFCLPVAAFTFLIANALMK